MNRKAQIVLVAFLHILLGCENGKKKADPRFRLPHLDAATVELEKNGIPYVQIAEKEIIPEIKKLEIVLREKDIDGYFALLAPEYGIRIRKVLIKDRIIDSNGRLLPDTGTNSRTGHKKLFATPAGFWDERKWAISCWHPNDPVAAALRYDILLLDSGNALFDRSTFAFRFARIGPKFMIIAEDFNFGEMEPFYLQPGENWP